jgi:hypothetical protein
MGYRLKSNGGPLARVALKSIVTSARLAILIKGMPLSIPNSLRSNAIVPVTLAGLPRLAAFSIGPKGTNIPVVLPAIRISFNTSVSPYL